MLTDTEGKKITAKNKAKLIIKQHLDNLKIEDCEGFEDFSKGDIVKVQDQVAKIRERLDKVLIIK